MHESSRTEKGNFRNIKIIGLILLAAAVILLIWSLIIQVDDLHAEFLSYVVWLSVFEDRIASLPSKVLIGVLLIVFFFIRSFVPLLPAFVFFIISGMVFPLPVAMLIDLAGIFIMMSCKYRYGRHRKPTMLYKLLELFPVVTKAIERNGKANPWLLFVFMLAPAFPINMISQLYGYLDFPYKKFILISMAGYLPKIVMYGLIGKHIYDPFSGKFLMPIIILLLCSGAIMLALNWVLQMVQYLTARKKMKEDA